MYFTVWCAIDLPIIYGHLKRKIKRTLQGMVNENQMQLSAYWVSTNLINSGGANKWEVSQCYEGLERI